MQENPAAEDAQAFGTSLDDPVFAAEQARRSSSLRLREKERRYHADAVGRVAARAVEAVRRHLHGVAVQIRAVRLIV